MTKVVIWKNSGSHVPTSSLHVLWSRGWRGRAKRGGRPVKRRHVDFLGDMFVVVVAGMNEGVRARHTSEKKKARSETVYPNNQNEQEIKL